MGGSGSRVPAAKNTGTAVSTDPWNDSTGVLWSHSRGQRSPRCLVFFSVGTLHPLRPLLQPLSGTKHVSQASIPGLKGKSQAS